MGIDITYHQDGLVVVESLPRVVESSVGEAFGRSTTPAPTLVTSTLDGSKRSLPGDGCNAQGAVV